MTCCIDGCLMPDKCKGMCGKHYKRSWRHGDPSITLAKSNAGLICSVAGCTASVRRNGMCNEHSAIFRRTGDTVRSRQPNGEARSINTNGYIIVSRNGLPEYEHIIVAEKAFGKKLPAGAIVHHADGNPANNEPTNLVICPDQAYHMLLHKRINEARK